MEITLKNIYKGNDIDNHTKYFPFLFKDNEITLKKKLNHTEKLSVLLISFVPRIFSITVL